MSASEVVATATGEIASRELGVTLMHEHLFVRDPELDRALPDGEWDEAHLVAAAVQRLQRLHAVGISTVCDLTVPGLGRDVGLVARVAQQTDVNIVVSTGWYYTGAFSPALKLSGPGGVVDGDDPLMTLMERDVTIAIAGTSVRAGMIKIAFEDTEANRDVTRLVAAAANASLMSGTPITTHSNTTTPNGALQQSLLMGQGVPADRIIIGHAGDVPDLDYLTALADAGSSIGFDRFGMSHVGEDSRRMQTLLELIEAGYASRVVVSQDSAIYSRATPPDFRTRRAPDWRIEHLFESVIPALRVRGVADSQLQTIFVDNPARLLGAAGQRLR